MKTRDKKTHGENFNQEITFSCNDIKGNKIEFNITKPYFNGLLGIPTIQVLENGVTILDRELVNIDIFCETTQLMLN